MLALNLDETTKRVLSACDEKYNPDSQYKVNELPDGDLYDYKFINGLFEYDPIPEPEPEPEFNFKDNIQLNRADIDYLSMMSDIPLDDDEVTKMKNDRSPKFELVRKYYRSGLWSEKRVRDSVVKGWITQAECDEILQENK